MKRHLLKLMFLVFTCLLGGLTLTYAQTNAWINEIHYDNASGDTGEGVEIVILNPDANLSLYRVVLYNGTGGVVYDSTNLSGITPTVVDNFSIYNVPVAGLQNGLEGIALGYNGNLLQFLSYEGVLTGVGDIADGVTSTDIGVSENGTDPIGNSLQLSGTGGQYSDFMWQSPAGSTFGAQNNNQMLVNTAPVITNIVQDPIVVSPSNTVTVSADISDNSSINQVTLLFGTVSGMPATGRTMGIVAGTPSTYRNPAPIQEFPEGTIVYYVVEATDDQGLVTTSPEQSYTVGQRIGYRFESGAWSPSDPSDATTPSTLNDDVIVVDGNATVLGNFTARDIIIDAGASLVLDNDFNVFLARHLTNNGDFTSRNANLFIVNTTTHTISGNPVILGHVTVNSTGGTETINFSTQSNVYGTLIPTNGTLNSNGNLVFKSDDQNIGIIGSSSATIINGDVVVERFIPSNRAFRLLASSVNTGAPIRDSWQEGVNNQDVNMMDNLNPNPNFGTHITGGTTAVMAATPAQAAALGFDATQTNNPSMFFVNQQGTPAYAAVENTNATNLSIGRGYLTLVRGSRAVDLNMNAAPSSPTVLRAAGVLQQGNFTVPASEMNQVGTGTSNAMSSSLIANPYQAPINMSATLTNGSANIVENIIHVFDPTLGSRGAFVTLMMDNANEANDMTSLTFPGSDGTGTTQVTRYLQVGQACFVNTDQTVDPLNPTASIVFQEDNKLLDNTYNPVFLNPNTTANIANTSIYMQLYDLQSFNTAGKPKDGLIIRFGESYSDNLTREDAKKTINLDENLATQIGEQLSSIESRFTPTESTEVPLFINNYRDTEYVLRMHTEAFENVQAYLYDNYLQTQIELTPNQELVHSFSIDTAIEESSASDRFKVIFTDNVLGTDDLLNTQFTVYPNPVSNGILNIQMTSNTTEASLEIYNLLGQNVKTVLLEAQRSTVDVSSLSGGIYIVELTTDGPKSSQRIIIQ